MNLVVAFLGLLMVGGLSTGVAGIVTLGPGVGVTMTPNDPPPCDGTLLMNADGTWETAWAWDGGGVAPPDFGGFGEGYTYTGSVCGMQVYLTIGDQFLGYGLADAFVYDSDGENPLNVLGVTVGVEIEGVAMWPEISVHEIGLDPVDVDGEFFVYLWPDWPGQAAHWTFAASVNGPEGKPRTRSVYEGWQHPNQTFGDVQAMGIGAYVSDEPVPTGPSSWGSVKALYRP